ncbi:MAG TPA: translocation/assembly module TamB domain-containing protein, partial [Blastocatellia bacterium]|nr:translocation/assembly module TamB domain-containing protein [Blastocatellia bacterium]
QNIAIAGRQAGPLQVTARTTPDGKINLNVVTGVTGAPQTLTATLDLKAPGTPITVSTDLKNLDISAALAILYPDLANTLAGNLTGSLRVSGPVYNDNDELTMDRLRGSFTISAITLAANGTPITVSTPVSIRLQGPQVTVDQIHISGQGVNLLVGGTLALNAEASMNFSLSGTADLALLTASSRDISAQGKLDIDAHAMGTVSDPKLSGSMALRDGSVETTEIPVELVNATGSITLAGDKITLQSFKATANDGTITAAGSITLAQLFKPSDWNFKLQASGVDFYYQGASVVAEGTLTFAGTPQGQTVSGTINIPEGEYLSNFDFSALATAGGGGSGFDLGISGPSGSPTILFGIPVNLDVNINAPDTLLVRNTTVNTVATAALHVGGTLGNTDVTGRISLNGGTIKFRGQKYDITAGTLIMTGGAGSVPEVNLEAESTVSGDEIYVGIRGPINDLDLTLNSDPQLTRAEILSLIATGRTDTGTVNSDQMVQSGLTTAASLLTSEVLFNPLGEQAQQRFGLSQFQIDPIIRPNTNPAARLTIGRQLARNLSFLYSTNLSSEQDQVISLEYDLTNRFSVIAGYSQGGLQATQTTTDNIFTFDIRGRKRFALGKDFSADLTPGIKPKFEKTVRPPAVVDVVSPDVKISKSAQKSQLPIESEGYSRALMRLGEVNMKNYLQQKGYFFADVKARCEPLDCSGESVHVVYDVTPDRRYDLEKVEIEGAPMLNTHDIKSKLETQQASFVGGIPLLSNLPFLGGLARGITSTDRLRNDRETIRKAMADAGYRSAQVTSRMGISINSENLVVTFSVDPGPLSSVSEITIYGIKSVEAEDVREQVDLAKGAPFNLTAARQGAQKIDTYYAQKGFLDVATNLDIEDLPGNKVHLKYTVDEGERAVVREIKITGEVATHENAIRQFLAFNTGDVLTPQAMRQSQRDLYATGAFREVNISPEKINAQGSERRVVVKVTEAKPLLLTYGLGYSTDVGPRGLLEITHSNLFGRANSATIRTSISARDQLGQILYNDPRPMGTKWPLTLSVYYDHNTNVRAFVPEVIVNGIVQSGTSGPAFGVNRFAAYAQLQHRLNDHTSVRARYDFENVKLFNIQNIPILEIARNEQSIRLGDLSVGFTRDTRDSVVDPEKGKLFSADYTFAASFLGGNENYNKFFGNFQNYHTLPKSVPLIHDSVLAFAARLGLAAPFKVFDRNGDGVISEPERELPISERFFAGGVTTLRGFRFEEAGPQGILEPTTPNGVPTLVPIGGDALVVFNTELRIPIGGPFRLVPFYDLGNVFQHPKDISFGGMTNTIGIGLRIKTPIGPIGVDFGHLLDPPVFFSAQGIQLQQPSNVFHIRFGQTF